MRPGKSALVAAVLAAVSSGCAEARGENIAAAESELVMVEHAPVLLAAMVPARVRQPLPAEPPAACPDGMVLVEGGYCPDVEHSCRRYLDPEGPYEHFRCAEYDTPRCKSAARVPMRFCMDADEFTLPGERLPENFKSFTHAERLCAAQGKRVCRESEWNLACEGEEMRPYPYGFARDSSACNADRFDLVGDDGRLKDQRVPSDTYPRCISPFGVRNMAGNLEEFVAMDGRGPPRPAMKGAYWQPSRNHCRAAQTAHDRYYNGIETGFRCCAGASSAELKAVGSTGRPMPSTL